jgi:hypothetical protein
LQRAPEDTLVAYWGGIGAGADGLALAVQPTADAVPICCQHPTLANTCGDPRGVTALSWNELRRLDAGTMFCSTELDARNQPVGDGSDHPWDGIKSKQKPLYHPKLSEVLLLFGRRTSLLLLFPLLPDAKLKPFVQTVCREVDRFGLAQVCLFASDEKTLRLVKTHLPKSSLAYVASKKDNAASTAKTAKRMGARHAIIDVERLIGQGGKPTSGTGRAFGSAVKVLVASTTMPFALTPEIYAALRRQPWLAGFLCRSVDRMVGLERKRHLIVEDQFAGQSPDLDLWTMGYSKISQDTTIRQKDSVIIEIKAGGQYSGAAAACYKLPDQGRFRCRHSI